MRKSSLALFKFQKSALEIALMMPERFNAIGKRLAAATAGDI